MDSQFEKGPRFVGDGTEETPWMEDGCSVVSHDVFGRYYPGAKRGFVYSAFASTTVVAGNASPLGAGGTALFALYNPTGNQYIFSVLRARQASVSGTPGGPLIWNVMASGNPITVAGNGTPIQHKTYTSGGSARIYAQTALTGSSAMSALRVFGGPSAVALSGVVESVDDIADGDITVAPGQCVALAATAPGTTHIIQVSFTWVEIPLQLS